MCHVYSKYVSTRTFTVRWFRICNTNVYLANNWLDPSCHRRSSLSFLQTKYFVLYVLVVLRKDDEDIEKYFTIHFYDTDEILTYLHFLITLVKSNGGQTLSLATQWQTSCPHVKNGMKLGVCIMSGRSCCFSGLTPERLQKSRALSGRHNPALLLSLWAAPCRKRANRAGRAPPTATLSSSSNYYLEPGRKFFIARVDIYRYFRTPDVICLGTCGHGTFRRPHKTPWLVFTATRVIRKLCIIIMVTSRNRKMIFSSLLFFFSS